MFLHLGNYIMSDGLFISLSLLWVSQLIWIIYRPAPMQIVCHAILLLCLFTVRYNAMFYPIVAALTIILSSLRPIVKILGIGLSLLLIGLFINYTESEFYKTNGIRQFAPFSGWQLANNALYMYQNIALSDADKVPHRIRELDSLVRKSFIMARQQGLVLNPYIKDYYIWGGQGSPLEDYKEYRWKEDTATDMFTKWASMGPLYSAYGGYLLRKYPIEYFKHFVQPNISNFFFPSIADLGHYNQGNNRIDYRAAKWFGYKRLTMPKSSRSYELDIIKPYPFAIALSNFAFLFMLLSYLLFREYKKERRVFNYIILVITSFWLLNFGFSTAASSVELRYQVFQFILCVSFSSILTETLLKSSDDKKNETVVINCQ